MDATKTISKSLGGDRLGSGEKMKVKLHKYNRSNHDLSFAWRSSANVGTLIPCLKKVALPGDTWSIDIESIMRTVPALGPLYGSYKMQIDVFECPIRLYNGLLHNNMTKIGLSMDQVVLPKIALSHIWKNPQEVSYDVNDSQIATDSLIGYLGLRGIMDCNLKNGNQTLYREFNAIPILAYWDIYKNYYANKQEEIGKFIGSSQQSVNSNLLSLSYFAIQANPNGGLNYGMREVLFYSKWESTLPQNVQTNQPTYQMLEDKIILGDTYYILNSTGVTTDTTQIEIILYNPNTQTYSVDTAANVFPNANMEQNGQLFLDSAAAQYRNYRIQGIAYTGVPITESTSTIIDFPLSNIDDARINILQNTGLNNKVMLNNMSAPYLNLTVQDSDGNCINKYHQYGLGLKTYQSDIFNNWLRTEWIDGTGGINEITAVDTTSGSFTMDALNLAKKVYNMLNRIAVSGGSYEDYIEAVYSTEVTRRAESPIYCGGVSYEVVFEEIVSQAASEGDALGTLAGKGTITNKRGGHIEIHVEEPSYIIGIMSITPRIDYSQGNDWDMTELDTMADFHKPELDGIGFEDLLQERAAWWGTYFDVNAGHEVKLAMGKSPAWINYMTSVNETHGDFAVSTKKMWMTLNRQYEYHTDFHVQKLVGIKDATTYIDPRKYNYIFADSSLDAQNFWVQIGWKINTRRVMSAKIMPTM